MPYTSEEKFSIIKRYKQGETVAEISKESGVARATIYRWIKDSSSVASCEKLYSPRDIYQLERRLKKVENIVHILKTVDCSVSSPLKDRLAALEKLYEQYDVHTICEALDVPRPTFYNHMRRNLRNNAWFVKRKEEYRILIRDVYYEFDQIFGADKSKRLITTRR